MKVFIQKSYSTWCFSIHHVACNTFFCFSFSISPEKWKSFYSTLASKEELSPKMWKFMHTMIFWGWSITPVFNGSTGNTPYNACSVRRAIWEMNTNVSWGCYITPHWKGKSINQCLKKKNYWYSFYVKYCTAYSQGNIMRKPTSQRFCIIISGILA